jgi:CO/xanthine dehydrogenase FAD-binding subunit
LEFGGTATLQGLVDSASQLPDALIRAALLEAGWNIRNKATMAGTIVTGDGRSPLLTVLLALGADLAFAPGDERRSLAEVLDSGSDRTGGKLITAIHASNPSWMKYAQVARSPADRPQICIAVAAFDSKGPVRIAVGGHGAYPQLISKDENLSIQGAAELAGTMYSEAGDQWASADYRSSVAATLVARLLAEAELK